MKTTISKPSEITQEWLLVDAENKPAGRLAAEIARVLRGKHKPCFAPHLDLGDFVIVINARKVALTGSKETGKLYQTYTGFTGGLRKETAAQIRDKHPERIIRQAVRGMLPKNRLSRRLMSRLKVYADAEHPHAAQQPKECEMV